MSEPKGRPIPPRKERAPESKPGVPAWIVSFSDMVTLLLAFFVLLQTFAKDRDPDLFHAGQGSFQRAVSGMGMPDWLFGKRDNPEFGHVKPKHTTPESTGPKARGRIINARDDEVRQRFDEIVQQLELEPDVTDVKEVVLDVVHAPIKFTPGRLELSAEDKQYLDNFAKKLRGELATKKLSIYVVGTATDIKDNQERWMVSAGRALAVEQFFRTALGRPLWDRLWQLNAWGSPNGRLWYDKLIVGGADKQTPIVIAVLAAGD